MKSPRQPSRPVIEEQLREAVSRELGLNEDAIDRTSEFGHDLGADSLDQIEIVRVAEETFGLAIDEDVADGFKTFGQLVDYIDAELNRRKAASA